MSAWLTKKAVLIPGGILVLIAAAALTTRSFYLRDTKAALERGDLTDRGLLGRITSPRAGCLYFVDKIDTETFIAFLKQSPDQEAKTFIIGLLGWQGREDAQEYLRSLAASENALGRSALVSATAIEKHIPFPHKDFAEEYYRDYAEAVAQAVKEKNLPLKEAAAAIAQGLVLKYKAPRADAYFRKFSQKYCWEIPAANPQASAPTPIQMTPARPES